MDNLIELIQSMTKMEKRNFVLEQKNYSPPNNIFLLYQEIYKEKQYDEPHLKRVFRDYPFVKILPTIKNQLYKALLSSMREYHRKSNVDFIIRNELTEIDILIKKKLYVQALKKLKSIKKSIDNHERFTYYMEVILKETELKFYTQKNQDFVDEIQKSISSARRIGRYYYSFAYQKLMLFRTQSMLWNGSTFEEINYIPTREVNLNNVRSAYYFNLHHSILYFIQIKDYKSALGLSDELMELMENNAHEFEDNPEQKVDVWYTCGMAYLFNRIMDKFDVIVLDIASIKSSNRRIQIRREERLIDLKLLQIFILNRGNEELGSLHQKVIEWEKEFSIFYIQKFWDTLSSIYLKSGDYKMALKSNYKLLIYKKNQRANHYFIRATLREVYIYFVQGKHSIFESRHKSVYRSSLPLNEEEIGFLKSIKNGERVEEFKTYLLQKKKT